jgi:hypothetical protein
MGGGNKGEGEEGGRKKFAFASSRLIKKISMPNLD